MRWGVELLFLYHPPGARRNLVIVVASIAADGRIRMAALLEKHYARLRLVALRLARTADQADDLVQQAALAALSTPARLRSDEAFVAWCRTAMVHDLVDRRRSLGYEILGSQNVLDPALSGLSSGATDPLEQAVTRADALRALGTLSESARRIVVLVDLVGMDYHAVARLLGVPVGTVRSRLHRARERLRKYLLA